MRCGGGVHGARTGIPGQDYPVLQSPRSPALGRRQFSASEPRGSGGKETSVFGGSLGREGPLLLGLVCVTFLSFL